METQSRINLLVVDDQPSNLLALESMLSDLGHSIVKAASGREALRHLLKKDFAVILLDARMPELDGFETARLIRQRERSRFTPIIFITAALMAEEMVFKGYSVGAVDYLIKPVVPEILRGKVRVFVELATMRQKLEAEIIERKRAEEEVRQSEEKFSKIFHSSLIAISISTLKEGRLIEANDAFLRPLGYRREEAIGRTTAELGIWANHYDRAVFVEKLLTDRSLNNIEASFRAKSGELRHLLASVELIDLEGEQCVLALFKDITERKIAERTLAEERNLLRTLIDNLPDYILVKDSECRYVTDNVAHAHTVGATPDEVVGKTVFDFYPRERAEKYHSDDLHVIRSGQPIIDREGFFIDRAGKERWVLSTRVPLMDGGGRVVGLVGISRDITERKRTEESLRESEERYRRIVETAEEGIWTIDAESNTVFVNRKMAGMLGYSVEEMLGQPLFKFMDGEWQAIAASNVERRRQGIREQHEFKFRRKDGTELWALLNTSPLLGEDGSYEGALAMITDITDRKIAEEELRKREKQLSEAQRLANLGSWEWDVRTNRVSWSDELYRIYGLKPHEFGATFEAYLERVHHEDREIARKAIERTFRDLRPFTFEERIVRPDGTIRTLYSQGEVVADEEGRPLRMMGICQDITERRQVEESLGKSETLNRAILESALDGIITIDHEGRVVEFNHAAENMFGYTRDNVIGRSMAELIIPPSLRGVHRQNLQRYLATGETSVLGKLIEMYAIRSDGIEFPVELSVVHIPGSEPPMFTGFVRDIAERKQAEAALKESEERFRRLAENAQDVIYRYRLAPTRGFDYVSPAATAIVGYTPEEHYLDPDLSFKLMHPDDRPLLEALVRGDIPQRTPFTLRWVRKDGTTVWTEQRNVPIYDGAGNLVAIEGIARDVTERKQAEEKLKEYAERLQILSHRLLEAQETERRAIARELHDEIGQALTGLKLTLETSVHLPADAFRAKLGEARALVNDLMTRVRDMSLDLRPAMLDDLGLLPALLWLFERYTAQTRVRVIFKHTGLEERRFSPEVETASYRIVQEGLTNIARHAGADEATVRVWADREVLGVQIEDKGRGFDLEGAPAAKGTGGLSGMRERAELLGGQLTIESLLGAGTCLTAEFPLSLSSEVGLKTGI
jgi:two-component system sensor histidine kinase UhpB